MNDNPTSLNSQQRLGSLLLERGLITQAELDRALEVHDRTGDRLGSILMALGMVKRRDLYYALAHLWGHPFVDLINYPLDVPLAHRFASAVLLEKRFVPLSLFTLDVDPILHVATSEVPSRDIEDAVREVFGPDARIEYSVTTDWDIDKALANVFKEELVTTATMGLYYRNPEESAYRTFRKWQVLAFVSTIVLLVACAVVWTVPTLVAVSAVVNLAFLCSIGFKLVMTVAGAEAERAQTVTDGEVAALQDRDLPTYTILLPVYREANIVGKLMDNLRDLDYPASKLEILLLIEETDEETLNAARASRPPETVTFVIVPDGVPRTKPRACNFGLFFAKGDFLVIYDAEDRPEPDQLKKAVVAFERGGEDLICVQAALNYFNASENVLTRMFTLEYSYWFDYMLPGLDRLKLPIPLGGTSNHFRTDRLREVGGWDPFNVTEDADLGIRAAARGYRVGVVNSTTYEEANNRLGNWIRQRSRWIKGYMQTTLVYCRDPIDLVRRVGLKNALGFALLIGGTPLTFLFTLPMWLMFGAWAVFGLPLEVFYPKTLLLIGLANLIIGNGMMVAVNMVGVVQRRYFRLLAYAMANPGYWMLHSIASYKALWQLFTNPFYWEKTDHGLVNESSNHHAPAKPPGRSPTGEETIEPDEAQEERKAA